MTTSTFTQHAREYAASIPTRIVLIDGKRLVSLMLKYRVGVQVKQSYDVVDIDEDFFE
ncbi:restriction endonuclease [Glutamicibacter arilaitensis]|uniref:restriction endonuclease n=1 Tax=Glutamicibacter arilaitensis TaxID=256701 RepID=UPI003F8FA504